ncbi:MAG: hypothetical protein IKY41_06185 [Clostridia bacterium]|nr:hypothetical protein [Clostridia bacterium]
MAMNFRNVNDLETVSKLNGGDKLLVNSGGVAKQVDANMVGGSGGGGGGIVYTDADLFSEATSVTAHAYMDAELTQPMDYATGKKLLMGGAVMSAPVPDAYQSYGLAGLTGSLIAVAYVEAAHEVWAYAHGFVTSGELPQVMITLKFSDSMS